MFETMTQFHSEIIIGLLAGVVVLAAWLITSQLSQGRMRRRLDQQQLLLDELRNDMRGLYAGAVGTDKHIQGVEEKMLRLTERQELLENTAHTERPYEQAIRMVQKGASVEDLMTVCSLSRGEADLIKMMHGKDKKSDQNAVVH